MNRTTLFLTLVALTGLPAACAPADEPDSAAEDREGDAADVPSTVDDEALATWTVRLDDAGADQSGFQVVETGAGLEIETGPAGVVWRPADLVASGDFTASATFTERSEGDHAEAYGVFVGGRHLESPDQEYTYFLVRRTDEYLVKRRRGDETEDIVAWSPIGSDVVGDGATLEVRVRQDSTAFLVDGEEVHRMATEEARPYGLVGLRVNHRLDVEVRDWSVTGEGVGSAGDARDAGAAARDRARGGQAGDTTGGHD